MGNGSMSREGGLAASTAGGRRVGDHVQRGRAVTVLVDGEPMEAYEGETLGAALLASGRRVLRHTAYAAAPRGLYCGMGVCFDCVVEVDGRQRLRACMTEVRDGMSITTGED
jgi:aerobic-type carbon monoxide dehydrogenase small subunit (CoxS/CutS family)